MPPTGGVLMEARWIECPRSGSGRGLLQLLVRRGHAARSTAVVTRDPTKFVRGYHADRTTPSSRQVDHSGRQSQARQVGTVDDVSDQRAVPARSRDAFRHSAVRPSAAHGTGRGPVGKRSAKRQRQYAAPAFGQRPIPGETPGGQPMIPSHQDTHQPGCFRAAGLMNGFLVNHEHRNTAGNRVRDLA